MITIQSTLISLNHEIHQCFNKKYVYLITFIRILWNSSNKTKIAPSNKTQNY